MSLAESDSGLHSRLAPAEGGRCGSGGSTGDGHRFIWLDGDVLACSCPKCRAPMSVRLWLLVADCWRCGTSIELTEEQEQEALRLLRQRQMAQRGTVAPNARPASRPPRLPPARPGAGPAVDVPPPVDRPAPVVPVPHAAVPRWESVPTPAARSPRRPPGTAAGRTAAACKPGVVRSRLDRIRTVGPLRRLAAELSRDFTCWLASLVFHLVLIILLGLWMIDARQPDRTLILATEANLLDQPGHAELFDDPVETDEFDDPGAIGPEQTEPDPFAEIEPKPTDPLPIAGANPGEMLEPALPPLLASGPLRPGEMLAGRDPRVRRQMVEREGGTAESESAVARGLVWLARHQNSDGSWSLDKFNLAGDCDGRCSHGGAQSDQAATALALLPFLGAGQTHLRGDYAEVVKRGLHWLVEQQGPDGDLRGDGLGRMYAQGIAGIALCEAYALTQDELLRKPAQRAIDFIVEAQHTAGGWRYFPGQEGDLSVVGWQLMALRSAQMAYLNVPAEAFTRAGRFLDSVQADPSVGLFNYLPGFDPSAAMTAEGLLCRQFSGWKGRRPELVAGVDWLLRTHPPRSHNPNMYYWYYATQVMHHTGGDAWIEWNGALRDLLVSMQETTGHQAGSWTPQFEHDPTGGRLYMTALAVCTLEVYYRHLPLYSSHAVE